MVSRDGATQVGAALLQAEILARRIARVLAGYRSILHLYVAEKRQRSLV